MSNTERFKTAADLLEAHNAWRRGADGEDRLQNVKALGEAIDTALECLRATAPEVAQATQKAAAWQERQMLRGGAWGNWYACRDLLPTEPLSDHVGGIPYEWRPLFAGSALRQEPAAPIDELAGDWFCERHPDKLMNHDGCSGAGITESERIPLAMHLLRMSRQETRETAMYRDDLVAKLRARPAAPQDDSMAPAVPLSDLIKRFCGSDDHMSMKDCIVVLKAADIVANAEATATVQQAPEGAKP